MRIYIHITNDILIAIHILRNIANGRVHNYSIGAVVHNIRKCFQENHLSQAYQRFLQEQKHLYWEFQQYEQNDVYGLWIIPRVLNLLIFICNGVLQESYQILF